MPYIILYAMAANLIFLQVGGKTALGFAGFVSLVAFALLAVRFAREGLFGAGLRRYVAEAPVWQVFALGIGVFALEVVASSYAGSPAMSRVIRAGLGPIAFGTVFAAIEIAVYRKKNVSDNRPRF